MGSTELNGKVTLDVVMRIEAAMDKSLIGIAQMVQSADLTTIQMARILTPVIRAGGNDVSEKEVAKIVFNAGLSSAFGAISDILGMALNPQGEDLGNGEDNP